MPSAIRNVVCITLKPQGNNYSQRLKNSCMKTLLAV